MFDQWKAEERAEQQVSDHKIIKTKFLLDYFFGFVWQ